jgi:hypothetical protein
MKKSRNVSVKNATDELLETSIFKNVARRTNKNFAQKLAMWMVRYILIISSMNESLKINLETILLRRKRFIMQRKAQKNTTHIYGKDFIIKK